MMTELESFVLIEDYVHERAGGPHFSAALLDTVEVFSVQLVHLSSDALWATNPVT